jgi:ankyrin repeat protein
MNKLCPRRQIQQTKVKFQDRDIFLSACQSGDEEEVEGLLQKGSDINVSSIDGVTALHQVISDGLIIIDIRQHFSAAKYVSSFKFRQS